MSNIKLSSSSELLTNYLNAEYLAPQKKFEALQTPDGHSLLFGISSDGVFNLVSELNNKTTNGKPSTKATAGWVVTSLSSALLAQHFQGRADAACRTFEVGQSVQDGTIGMALVVEAGGEDHLFLCMGNSNSNISWANDPGWVHYKYDIAGDKPLPKLSIANVFFCETADSTQYVVVDVLRRPGEETSPIYRFYLSPTQDTQGVLGNDVASSRETLAVTGVKYWKSVDHIPADFPANAYMSCAGRLPDDVTDGIYTTGNIGQNGTVHYIPLENPNSRYSPPEPVFLNLPESVMEDAMASVRNADLTTDLYIAAKGSLYFFASENQADGATATKLITNELFGEVSRLFALSSDTHICIWGLSHSNEVFYTTCLKTGVSNGANWSVPMIVLSKVDMLSPYINKNNNKTLFAISNNDLFILSKPDKTDHGKTTMWQAKKVTIEPGNPDPVKNKAIVFTSYTTRIQARDENNQPVPKDTKIDIKANARAAFYVNNVYIVLDTDAAHLTTDTSGCITLIEAVEGLHATSLVASVPGGDTLVIDPMANPMGKIKSMKDQNNLSTQGLKDASYTDQQGNNQKLLSGKTHDDDSLNAAAEGLKGLVDAHASLSAAKPVAPVVHTAQMAARRASTPAAPLSGTAKHIAAEFGDVYNWLKSKVDSAVTVFHNAVDDIDKIVNDIMALGEYVIGVIKDKVSDAWHFVAKIGEQVFTSVLDCLEKVLGAAEWLFKAIGGLIENIIKFFEFLFNLKQIANTQKVLKHLLKGYLEFQVGQLPKIRARFDTVIADLKSSMLPPGQDFSGLKDSKGQSAMGSQSSTSSNSGAGDTMVSHHFENNAHTASVTLAAPGNAIAGTAININIAGKVETDIINLMHSIISAGNDLGSKPIGEVLKNLCIAVAESGLDLVKDVVDVFFTLLETISNDLLTILDYHLHIPVISDILDAFGIEIPSLLDIFCWVAAVPATLIYVVADKDGKAPFEDDNLRNQLLSYQFSEPVTVPAKRSAHALTRPGGEAPLPQQHNDSPTAFMIVQDALSQKIVFATMHFTSGVLALINTFTNLADAEISAEAVNDGSGGSRMLTILNASSAFFGGAAAAIAAQTVPHDELKNTGANIANGIATVMRIVNKLTAAWAVAEKRAHSGFIANPGVEPYSFKKWGTWVDIALVIPAVVSSGIHIGELITLSEDHNDKMDIAIINEVYNMSSYINRVTYFKMVNFGKDTPSVVIMVASGLIAGGSQLAEGALYLVKNR